MTYILKNTDLLNTSGCRETAWRTLEAAGDDEGAAEALAGERLGHCLGLPAASVQQQQRGALAHPLQAGHLLHRHLTTGTESKEGHPPAMSQHSRNRDSGKSARIATQSRISITEGHLARIISESVCKYWRCI